MAAGKCSGLGGKVVNALLSYDTVKIVTIKNKKVGFLHRLIQLLILGYVIGYAIIWKKGYQEHDTALSAVTTKVKGTAAVNFTGFKSSLYDGMEIFDPADYVVPAQENNEFFVMTNMIITPNQSRSACPEDPKFTKNFCETSANCTAGEPVVNGNGVKTGKCVKSDRNPNISVCQIYAWCPVEIDEIPMPGHGFKKGVPLLKAAKDFTVLIKNQITFEKFGFSTRNIINKNQTDYLKNCHYNAGKDELCPIFRLGHIVETAGYNFDELAYKGGIIAIMISWNCNLDYSSDYCSPKYKFKRIDDPNAPIAGGFNFRFSRYFVDKGRQHRILYKAYGIKFEVLVKGKAGKFSVVPLFLNLGSGLALLGIATIWCDIIVLYFLKNKDVYRHHKYHQIEDGNEPTDSDLEDVIGSPEGSTNRKTFNYERVTDEEKKDAD
eukprot:gene14287-15773_t